MKRKISFTALGIIFILLLISVRQNIVNADDQSEVMYTFQENEDFDLFINLPYNNLISEKCLIDNQEAKISEFYTLEDNCLVETVFLFDEYVLTNNPDIQKNAVQITKDILKNAGKNEMFCVASFGDDRLTVAADFTDNQLAALEAAEKIEYNSFDSDIYNGIRHMSAGINDRDQTIFRRIVVFTNSISVNSSDIPGNDKSIKYPLYFILMDEDEKPLYEDHMSSDSFFSRYYRCTGNTDSASVAEKINDFSHVYYCKAKIPQELLEADKDITVKMEFEGENQSASIESCAQIKSYIKPRADEKEKNNITLMVSVFAVIIILLSSFIIIFMRKLKKEEKKESVQKSAKTAVLPGATETLQTTVLSDSTRILLEDMYLCKIILTDADDPGNVIEISSVGEAIIGRNSQLSDYAILHEKSISQKHCKIFVRNTSVYVIDLESSNHTYVDGEMVEDETELKNGSILRIGRLSFEVVIIPM